MYFSVVPIIDQFSTYLSMRKHDIIRFIAYAKWFDLKNNGNGLDSWQYKFW